jgi:hypothetical protein
MKKLTLIITLLSVLTITNAQTNENIMLSTDDIQKNELKVTPELEKIVIANIKNLPEKDYSYYGITNKEQLENLQLGKPIPSYWIVYEEFKKEIRFVSIWNASSISDKGLLSLQFGYTWNVPVLSDGVPFLFVSMLSVSEGDPGIFPGIKNTIEHFYNYEHKDLVIGSVSIAGVNPLSFGMDYLIIRKDNQDIFVEVYNEATGEYFKNEYSFSELIHHLKELNLREKEARERYYDKIANKTELTITPEIAEIVVTPLKNMSEIFYANHGIKNKAQLEHLELGKPVPWYRIIDEDLQFLGMWYVPVMSDDEPLLLVVIRLTDDGEYKLSSYGDAPIAEWIHNYEYKDSIIGYLDSKLHQGNRYFYIRKEHKDIFVRTTRESFKNEYSLSELINLLKK